MRLGEKCESDVPEREVEGVEEEGGLSGWMSYSGYPQPEHRTAPVSNFHLPEG